MEAPPRTPNAAAETHDAWTIFAALGDPVRLTMIERLSDGGPLPTIRLTQGTSLTRQAITKHLRVLEEAGLVRSGRSGRDRAWQIEPSRIAQSRALLERLSARWDARLARLRALVEEEAG